MRLCPFFKKSEARNPKFETISKLKIQIFKTIGLGYLNFQV